MASIRRNRLSRLFMWLQAGLLLFCCAARSGETGSGTLVPVAGQVVPKGSNSIPSTLIELDGTISSSPDGSKLGYEWNQVSGPDVELSDPTSAKPYFRTSQPGTYVFELIVSANELKSEPHIVQLEIECENLPPVAKIPVTALGQVGKPLEIDGRDSFDPEDENLTYKWRTATPGLDIPLSALSMPILTFEPKVDGVFEVELVVSDGELSSPPARCLVTIKPKPLPPVARARVVTLGSPPAAADKPAESVPPAPARAAVSAPVPPPADSTPRLVPPPVSAEPATPVKAPVAAPVARPLPVTELAAMAPPAFVAPRPTMVQPVARIEAPEVAETGRMIMLDARSSFSPSGSRLEYFWKQKSGEFVSDYELVFDGAAERFMAPQPGEYEFELVVADGGVESEPVSHRVRVVKEADPPVAMVNAPRTASMKELIRMDASGSYDLSGGTLVYRWRQTGGTPVRNYAMEPDDESAMRPGFFAPAPGVYSFELIVSNGKVHSKPYEVDIEVTNSRRGPELSIDGPEAGTVGERMHLGAKVRGADGRTLTFAWHQMEGPAPALSHDGGVQAMVVPPVPGRYVFALSALEAGEAVASAQQVVEVFKGRGGVSGIIEPLPQLGTSAGNGAGGPVLVTPPMPVVSPTIPATPRRVPELTPLPNTPPPRPPPLASFPPAEPARGKRAAQVMTGTRYGSGTTPLIVDLP